LKFQFIQFTFAHLPHPKEHKKNVKSTQDTHIDPGNILSIPLLREGREKKNTGSLDNFLFWRAHSRKTIKSSMPSLPTHRSTPQIVIHHPTEKPSRIGIMRKKTGKGKKPEQRKTTLNNFPSNQFVNHLLPLHEFGHFPIDD
jgi:hypothetical protein